MGMGEGKPERRLHVATFSGPRTVPPVDSTGQSDCRGRLCLIGQGGLERPARPSWPQSLPVLWQDASLFTRFPPGPLPFG